MTLLEVENPNNLVRAAFDQIEGTTKFYATFILVLTTSKIFIFFIMDMVLVVMITKAGWAAATFHEFVDDRYQRNIVSQTNAGFENSQSLPTTPKSQNNGIRAATAPTPEQNSPSSRYDDPSKESEMPAFNYNDIFNNSEARKDEKVSKFIPRPSTLAIAYSERASKQDNTTEREVESRMNNYRKSTPAPVAPAVQRRAESPQRDYDKEIDEIFENTINSPVQRPKSLDRPWDEDRQLPDKQRQIKVRVLPPVFDIPKRNSSHLKQRPLPPPKPKPERQGQPTWLVEEERRVRERSESRSSSQYDGNGGRGVERSSSSAQGELRSQLPWSYFKARDDVPKQRVFKELEDDEDLPPVPVPDYTLHFGQTKRAPIDDSDGDGTFNRYEQRY